jgi:GT2 family glycosyltransferase
MDITRHPDKHAMLTVDVIIPSFRMNEAILLPILKLRQPQDAIVQFFLICDNPTAELSPALKAACSQPRVHFIKNEVNLGVSATRNRGIELSQADWILFLDDDIIPAEDILVRYAEGIRNYPEEVGFIGPIDLPAPNHPFNKAVIANGSMDIFGVARVKEAFAWGATANILFNRKAIGSLRFSAAFPKLGGGEDVDFSYQVRDQNHRKTLKCLTGASVMHPWWGNEKPVWSRPFRYGIGNSYLPNRHPAYAYYDFLTAPETLLVSFLLLPVFVMAGLISWTAALYFIPGVLLIEAIATGIQIVKRSKSFSPAVIVYGIGLRFIYEMGLLQGSLSRGQLQEIGLRFNFEGKTANPPFYHSNTRRVVKWILYPLLAFLLF